MVLISYNCIEFILNVLSSNKRAISFYKKCGFIYEGKFKDHLFIDDRYQDLEWYAICKK